MHPVLKRRRMTLYFSLYNSPTCPTWYCTNFNNNCTELSESYSVQQQTWTLDVYILYFIWISSVAVTVYISLAILQHGRKRCHQKPTREDYICSAAGGIRKEILGWYILADQQVWENNQTPSVQQPAALLCTPGSVATDCLVHPSYSTFSHLYCAILSMHQQGMIPWST